MRFHARNAALVFWLLSSNAVVGWPEASRGRSPRSSSLALNGGSSSAKELRNEVLLLANDTDRYFALDLAVGYGPVAVECRSVKDRFAFLVLSSVEALETRLAMLHLWWLPGASGCVYLDETILNGATRARLPKGLDVCYSTDRFMSKPWYVKYSRRPRAALSFLLLWQRYSNKEWYCAGHDDTLWSPLALSAWLKRFDPKDAWYIGGKSEDLSLRKRPEHWSWSPLSGGICLSVGLLENYAGLLEQCLDVIDWQGGATEGDWALHRCLQRLGIALTPAGGMHPLDVGLGVGSGSGSATTTNNVDSIGWTESKNRKAHRSLKMKNSDVDETQTALSLMRDVLERHPVAPFLSIHHPSRIFAPLVGIDHTSTWKQVWTDPEGFAQLTVCEVQSDSGARFSAAVSSGVSVRLWPGRLETLLWDALRVDNLEPPPSPLGNHLLDAPMRYVPGPLQPPPGSSGVGVNLVVYTPTTPERPYALIVVVSEKWPNSIRGGSSGGGEGSGYRGGGGSGGGSNGGSSIGGRWSGAPRRSCHVGSREITFESGSAVLLFSLRDCQAASINVPPRWPSDADLAAVAALVEPVPVRRRPRSDTLHRADHAFLPVASAGDSALDSFRSRTGSISRSGSGLLGLGSSLHRKNCSAVQCQATKFAPPDEITWGRNHGACGSRSAAPLDGTCAEGKGRSWDAANSYCLQFGTRLCSLTELSRGLGWNSGCQGSHEKYSWSASPCGKDSYFQYNQKLLLTSGGKARRCVPSTGGGAYFSPEGAPVCCADFPGCRSFDSPLTSSASYAAAAAVSSSPASLSLSLFDGAGDAALFERRRRLQLQQYHRTRQHHHRQLEEVPRGGSGDRSSNRADLRGGNHSKRDKRSRSRSRGSASKFAIDSTRAQTLFRAAMIAKGSSGRSDGTGLGQVEFTQVAKQLLSEHQAKASAVAAGTTSVEGSAPMPPSISESTPPLFSDAELQMAFLMADTNGNGLVDEDEFNGLLRSFSGSKNTGHSSSSSSGSSSSGSSSSGSDNGIGGSNRSEMSGVSGFRRDHKKQRDRLHMDEPPSRQDTGQGRQLRVSDVAKRCHWAAWKNALVCDGNGAPTAVSPSTGVGGNHKHSGSLHSNNIINNNALTSKPNFVEKKAEEISAPPPVFASNINHNDAHTAAVMAAAAELVPNTFSDALPTDAHQAISSSSSTPHKQGMNGAAGSTGGALHPPKKVGGVSGKHNGNNNVNNGGGGGGSKGNSNGGSSSGGGRTWSLDAFKDSGSSGRDGSALSMPRLPDHLLVANHTSPVWSRWLSEEAALIRDDVAFGIIGSVATLQSRVFLLKHWWLPGAQGCLYVERGLAPNIERKVPRGLSLCFTPDDLRTKPWYRDDLRATVRGGIIPIVTWRHFPGRKWYVIGDDDTMFSPLALAQLLLGERYPSDDEWYLGTRSENLGQRHAIGWDMGFGGGGIVLSGGLLEQSGAALERCYDDSLWDVAPGGDWILHRCLSRLGFPLTPMDGMHQLDSSAAADTRDVLERHPVSPFVSLHHPSRVFIPAVGIEHASFFRGMYHDPIGFLQLHVCESILPPDRNSVLAQTSLGNNGDSSSAPSSLRYEATNLTIAISGGLSVRLWTHRNFKLLWDQARSDVVVPFPGAALAAATNADARFAFAAVQHETTRGLATITLYAPDRGGGAEGHKAPRNPPSSLAAFMFVIVAEERLEAKWTGAPRKMCHVATHELRYTANQRVLLLALRDCRVPWAKPATLPTPEEVSDLISSAGGPSGRFAHQELPSGHHFVP